MVTPNRLHTKPLFNNVEQHKYTSLPVSHGIIEEAAPTLIPTT